MKLKIASDSALRLQTTDARGRHARILPWVWLVWLVLLFIGPTLFGLKGFPNWQLPTFLSVPVFLVLYVLAHVCPRRQIIGYAIVIAAIGVAVTPYNPFAQTYLIYACAVAACWSSPRKSGGLVLAMLVAYSVWWLHLQFPWPSLLNAWILCPIITGLTITERIKRQHRAELRLSMDEVRRLAASAERERIGRDLHDLLGHTLSLVALKSELAERLIESDPHTARREIREVGRVARDALAQVRRAVTGIRAAALVSELASGRLLLETAGIHMEYRRDDRDLPSDVETCLALALREAVTNVERHARANHVEVSVESDARQVRMRIHDDGRGGVNARGNGLIGMGERVQALDGKLDVDSPRGHGTTVEVTLPLPPASKPELGPATPQATRAVVTPIAHHAGSHA